MATTAASDRRFRMQQGGRNMSANDFDAWMRTHGIHVATGRPATVSAATARQAPAEPAPVLATAAATATAPTEPPTTETATLSNAAAAAPAAATTVAGSAAAPDAKPIVLQVASFSSEANAKQALSILLHAAITRAQLLVAEVSGHQVWRLRVGPVEPESEAELASRIEGLGLGRPQRVTD